MDSLSFTHYVDSIITRFVIKLNKYIIISKSTCSSIFVSYFTSDVFVLLFTDLATEDKLEYHFFPVSSGAVQFKVRTPNDAHIALTMGPAENDPMVEVRKLGLLINNEF